jgi:hypothetical protein
MEFLRAAWLSVLAQLPDLFHKKALSVLKKQLEGLLALE